MAACSADILAVGVIWGISASIPQGALRISSTRPEASKKKSEIVRSNSDRIGRFETTLRVGSLRTKPAIRKRRGRSDLRQSGRWRRAIASLINVADPQIAIIGGGIARAGRSLFEPLARAMDDFEWRPNGNRVRIEPAQLGEYAGALGAARNALTQDSNA